MDFYWGVFGVLTVAIAAALFVSGSEGSVVPANGAHVAAYKRHMQGYVVIYSLMMRECRATDRGCGEGHGSCYSITS
jgi:hypothetical protein